ncbi:hypothetical protein N8128_06900, partial [Paracoccaceae bacterium]|nr:hypothetical protein [Paracoccaceae bacterium]
AYTGDGNDQIKGDAGINKLYGGRGKDLIEGGLGSDIIDGGNGFDTAVYAGARGDYTLAFNNLNQTLVVTKSCLKRPPDIVVQVHPKCDRQPT